MQRLRARVDCVAPALVIEYIAPARVAPSLQLPPVNFDIPGLMNRNFLQLLWRLPHQRL